MPPEAIAKRETGSSGHFNSSLPETSGPISIEQAEEPTPTRLWLKVQRYGRLIFEGLLEFRRKPGSVNAFFGPATGLSIVHNYKGLLFRAFSNEHKVKIISYLPLEYLKVKALSYLPLKDLEALSHSQQTRKLVRKGLKVRVHDTLLRFRLSPSKTLRMMRQTKTVISGSAALKVIDACQWEANDVDFYCPKEEIRNVLSWFERHRYHVVHSCKSYSFTTAAHDPSGGRYTTPEVLFVQLNANNCIETVFTLRNELSGDKINVIQSRSSSAVAPIAFFHSTIVMNFISSDTVVCGYPSLTLRGQGLMNAQTMPPLRAVKREVSAVAKYQRRGYTFIQGRNEDPTFNPDDPHRNRSWTDRHSLRMEFRGRNYRLRDHMGNGAVGDGEWKVSYREWYMENGFIEYPAQFLVEEREAGGRVFIPLSSNWFQRYPQLGVLAEKSPSRNISYWEDLHGGVGMQCFVLQKWTLGTGTESEAYGKPSESAATAPGEGCRPIALLQPMQEAYQEPLNFGSDQRGNHEPGDEIAGPHLLPSFGSPFVDQSNSCSFGLGYELVNWERHSNGESDSANPPDPVSASSSIPIQSPVASGFPCQIPWLDTRFIFEDRTTNDCQAVSTRSLTTLTLGDSQEALLESVSSLWEAIRELSLSARQLFLAIQTLSQALP
ncbi:hypothetical protein FA13DRAFT_1712673 [Coprinellus micaceus]|uniref:Uncharacterized protein n=1 Tax=Coprinellus micaceus TaxID=71717 RepID=A0A4Y7SZL5_COPMI|nr:hypothetical protein FA13DRAFT_1712673 [Coprinellus micaceus]